MHPIARRQLGIVVMALLAVGLFRVPAARAQIPGSLAPCPVTSDGSSLRCACWTPGHAPVWGTDVYAVESSICAAARHAGIIGEGGGAVRIIPHRGLDQYRGSYRNGITSLDKGFSRRSFRLERLAEPWGTAPRP